MKSLLLFCTVLTENTIVVENRKATLACTAPQSPTNQTNEIRVKYKTRVVLHIINIEFVMQITTLTFVMRKN